MLNVINVIKINDQWINHIIDTDTDETIFQEVYHRKLLMTVKSNCNTIIDDKIIGVFNCNFNSELWSFEFQEALEDIRDKDKEDSVKIKEIFTQNKSLIKAETKVFKVLVEMDIIKL